MAEPGAYVTTIDAEPDSRAAAETDPDATKTGTNALLRGILTALQTAQATLEAIETNTGA